MSPDLGRCIDLDGDGHGEGCAPGEDCDDGDGSVWSWVTLYLDQDQDSYSSGPSWSACTDGTAPLGYLLSPTELDCDDNDPAIYPGSPCDDGLSHTSWDFCHDGVCLGYTTSWGDCVEGCDNPGASGCCYFDCQSGECEQDCLSSAQCAFVCDEEDVVCHLACQPASSCYFLVESNEPGAQLACLDASCLLDCRDVSLCHLDCLGTASCLLRFDGLSGPSIDCPSGHTSCSPTLWACNRECPLP